ncbi:hypothetical protein DPMN_093906 [Dreissena polymorpha]|uniref:Uncharacterized protein n=1 Tax=Dreissena polymorpha TaxID=45954 RepID=A0A9D4L4Z5_DREPO|nr:hypothetical protein DPMN_093906 [Dreissena polymorpha]
MFSRTVNDAPGQPRHQYDCLRSLYGSYTDHPACCYLPVTSWINTAVLNFQKRSYWPPGARSTVPDVPGIQGSTRHLRGSHAGMFRI